MSGLILSAGCGLFKSDYCLETGCWRTYPDTVEIWLDPTFNEWPAGTYTFLIGVDNEVVTCTVTTGKLNEGTCSSGLITLWRHTTGTGDGSYTSLDLLQVNAFPEVLTLNVSRDGEEIASENFTLEVDPSDYPAPDLNDPCVSTCADSLRVDFELSG